MLVKCAGTSIFRYFLGTFLISIVFLQFSGLQTPFEFIPFRSVVYSIYTEGLYCSYLSVCLSSSQTLSYLETRTLAGQDCWYKNLYL